MLGCILEVIEFGAVLENSHRNYKATQQGIVKFRRRNPTVTIKILATKLQLNTRVIEKQLANLKKAKTLERKGSARLGEWVILKQDK